MAAEALPRRLEGAAGAGGAEWGETSPKRERDRDVFWKVDPVC